MEIFKVKLSARLTKCKVPLEYVTQLASKEVTEVTDPITVFFAIVCPDLIRPPFLIIVIKIDIESHFYAVFFPFNLQCEIGIPFARGVGMDINEFGTIYFTRGRDRM